MKISTNTSILSSQRSLERVSKAIARSLERLSSGRRLNSFADGAADYSTANTLEAQSRGMKQALLNINQSQGLIATADQALSTQSNIIQRMRELAVQAANGTLSASDRSNLQNEFQTLLSEFNRVTDETEFAGTKLLDGSFGTRSLQVGANSSDSIDLTLPSQLSSDVFQKTFGTGAFSASGSIQNISGSPRFVIGDFDGDGNQDAASADAGNPTVSVSFGVGDGTFQTRVTYGTGLNVNYAFAADLNNDGRDEIVVSILADSIVGILWNNGNGVFSSLTTLDTNRIVGNVQDSIVFEDINEDGLVDMAVGTRVGEVQVFINQGEQAFERVSPVSVTYSAAGEVGRPQLGDVNGDGHIDIVGTNTTAGYTELFLGDGTGAFGSATLLNTVAGTKLVDVDSDGDLDAVGFNSYTNSQIRVLLNNGAGSFGSAIDYNVLTSGTSAWDIELKDMNGDGSLDAIVGATGGTIQIAYNNGSGAFASGGTFSADGLTFTRGHAADFDNDGVNDILFGGTPAIGTTWYLMSQSTATGSAVSDLNLSSLESSQSVIELLDSALDRIAESRADLGILQSRLEFAYNHLATTRESIEDSRSQILDADIAQETSELAKNQILQQAAMASFTQANANLQMVLSLLNLY